jgi:tungstate transport system substrate-binding protein
LRVPSVLGSPLLLLAGAAACSSKSPTIGVESVLSESGLPEALFDAIEPEAGGVTPAIGESRDLFEKLQAGDLDLALVNGDLEVERLLREGKAASADVLLYHEMVLVGPDKDPAGLHAERGLENGLRAIIEGDAAFYRCLRCGARLREEAIFARSSRLPRRGNTFLDAGPSEKDVIRALQNAPGYGLLSRPTVIRRLAEGEWAFKPMWSGDPLQIDTYRIVVRAGLDEERKAAASRVAKALSGEAARKRIDAHADGAQRPFRSGAPPPGQIIRF